MGIALAIAALGSMTVVVLGWMSLVGKLAPNHIAGIRTPYTRRNPGNWYATHRAAAPLLIFGGVAALMTSLAFLPFALAGSVSDGLAVAVLIVIVGLLLVSAVGGWAYGTAAAKRGESQRDSS